MQGGACGAPCHVVQLCGVNYIPTSVKHVRCMRNDRKVHARRVVYTTLPTSLIILSTAAVSVTVCRRGDIGLVRGMEAASVHAQAKGVK